jgi:Flp pilus assembly protein TadG
MAIVLPIFVAFALGIVEFGRAFMVNQVITNAAREGARRAVVPGATDAQVTRTIDHYLAGAGITGHAATLLVNGSPAGLATARQYDIITVEVTVSHAASAWGIVNRIAPDRLFRAAVIMRKE